MTTLATPSLTPPAPIARLLRIVGQAPWGVADQMLISAANMAVIVLLAWALTQDDMGGYVLVSQAMLLFNSFQDGLITQPHNIIGPTLGDRAYERYSASTAAAHFALSGVFVTTILGAWAVCWSMTWWPAPLLLALAPATLLWQTQELVRRMLYTEGRVWEAFANDLVAYGGQAGGVVTLFLMGKLTGPRALTVIAVSSGIAAAIGLWRLRRTLRGRVTIRDAKRNWRVGKWLAGGEFVGVWVGDGTLLYLAAATLGKEAAAILRAIHTLFGPSRVIAMVLHTMLPIGLARRLAQQGTTTMHSHLRLTLLTMIPALGLFCLLMAVFARPLLTLTFGEPYAHAAGVMQVYAVAMLFCYVGMVLNASLKAQRQTRVLFMNRLLASLVTLGCGVSLLFPLGLAGVALGMASGYLCLAILNGMRNHAATRAATRFDEITAGEVT